MAMVLKAVGDLPVHLQHLHDRACQAIENGDPAYAVELLADLLREEPGCAAARIACHEALLTQLGGPRRGWRRAVVAARLAWPLRRTGPGLLAAGRAEEALALAEGMVRADAGGKAVLEFLAQACDAVGLVPVALETLARRARLHPCDPACWRGLADYCLRRGLHSRAVEALKRLAELRPDNLVIREDLRRAIAAVAEAEARGRKRLPHDVGTRRTEISLAPVVAAEVQPEGTLEERIARAEAAVRSKGSLRAYLDLGRLYAQAQRYNEALEALRQGAGLPDADVDTFQDEMVAVCQARYDDAIRHWREHEQAHPERAAEAQHEICAVVRERDRFLLEQQRLRAERHPHDSHVRFTLAEMLLGQQEWDEAILNFEAARGHPNLKAKCSAGIGRCLAGKGHASPAIPLLKEALDDGYVRQSRERLGVMYDLALAYEAVGRIDDANLVFKDIYTQDSTFRDVRDRLDRLAAQAVRGLR